MYDAMVSEGAVQRPTREFAGSFGRVAGATAGMYLVGSPALGDYSPAQLPVMAERTSRLLWRRHVARVVLQVTRCAHGALTGEVVSLRRAGELALPTASHTSRLLTDAIGYREGAQTSMYWGPFERKSNAGTLTAGLLRAVNEARPAS